MPGYNVVVDVLRLHNHIILCEVCKRIPREAIQIVSNGDRLCHSCYKNWVLIKNNQAIGLLGQAASSKQVAFFSDKAVRKEVNKIEIRCQNPGCSWTGNICSYENDCHEFNCPYSSVDQRFSDTSSEWSYNHSSSDHRHLSSIEDAVQHTIDNSSDNTSTTGESIVRRHSFNIDSVEYSTSAIEDTSFDYMLSELVVHMFI